MLNAASKELRTKEEWNELTKKYSMIAFSDINSDNEVVDDSVFGGETPDGEPASQRSGKDPDSKKFGDKNAKK